MVLGTSFTFLYIIQVFLGWTPNVYKGLCGQTLLHYNQNSTSPSCSSAIISVVLHLVYIYKKKKITKTNKLHNVHFQNTAHSPAAPSDFWWYSAPVCRYLELDDSGHSPAVAWSRAAAGQSRRKSHSTTLRKSSVCSGSCVGTRQRDRGCFLSQASQSDLLLGWCLMDTHLPGNHAGKKRTYTLSLWRKMAFC